MKYSSAEKNNIDRNRTLLQKFIINKTSTYSEPPRKGTPRGEPVGFSSIKYKASLLMLRATKKKDLADELDISYGLLRKWNSDNDFKDQVNTNCTEFIDFHLDNLKSRLANRKRGFDGIITQSLNKISNIDPDTFISEMSEYRDISVYRVNVKRELAKTLLQEVKKLALTQESYVDHILEIYRIFSFIKTPNETLMREIKKNKKEIHGMLMKHLSGDLRNTLLKIKTDDKRSVVRSLYSLYELSAVTKV